MAAIKQIRVYSGFAGRQDVQIKGLECLLLQPFSMRQTVSNVPQFIIQVKFYQIWGVESVFAEVYQCPAILLSLENWIVRHVAEVLYEVWCDGQSFGLFHVHDELPLDRALMAYEIPYRSFFKSAPLISATFCL